MDVLFDASFDAEEVQQHERRGGSYKHTATEENDGALSKERFQKEKVRRTSKGFDSSAFVLEKKHSKCSTEADVINRVWPYF